jgi:hypothetical protein
LSRAIKAASLMGLIIHVYLEDFHDIANPLPPSVKIYPLMDFESLVPNIQLALLYLSSTIG